MSLQQQLYIVSIWSYHHLFIPTCHQCFMCFGLTEEDNDDSLCSGTASYNWRDHCRNSNEKKVASSLPPPDIAMLSLTSIINDIVEYSSCVGWRITLIYILFECMIRLEDDVTRFYTNAQSHISLFFFFERNNTMSLYIIPYV